MPNRVAVKTRIRSHTVYTSTGTWNTIGRFTVQHLSADECCAISLGDLGGLRALIENWTMHSRDNRQYASDKTDYNS